MTAGYFHIWGILSLCCFLLFTESFPVDEKDSKILILGGGMAGVSAGKRLYNSGYRKFHILETSDRLGGRIRHEYVGDTAVEMGALWIYGRGSNPIFDLAEKHSLSYVLRLPDNWSVLNEHGEDVTDAADTIYDGFEESFAKYTEFATMARRLKTDDFTISTGIRHFNWRPQTAIEEAVETFMIDYETGIQSTGHSGKYFNLEVIYEDFESNDQLIVNDQRGFVHVVESIAEQFNDTSDRILYNKTVTEIAHFESGVNVTTSDGHVYSADYVIVTFSLGVLQHRVVNFSPPLPEWKQFAIDKFGISDFSHIYVKYHKPFWDPTTYILFTSKVRVKFSIWLNLNHITPGCNILQVSLMYEYARWADRSSDSEVLNEITSTLETMYPNSTIAPPIDYKISRWNFDPLFRGAFSYWTPGFTEQDMKNLGANVGRVFFAGEHTHPLHHGFVQGAYLTGESAAAYIIECIENSDTEICLKKHGRPATSGICFKYLRKTTVSFIGFLTLYTCILST